VRDWSRASNTARPAGRHAAVLDKLEGALGIDCAPEAAGPARREALAPALLVDAVAYAVDPAEAEALVDGVFVGDGWDAAADLVEAKPGLAKLIVVGFKPAAQVGDGGEVDVFVHEVEVSKRPLIVLIASHQYRPFAWYFSDSRLAIFVV
jgi:hypothetical protein